MKERKIRNEVQETRVRNGKDEKEIELLLLKGKDEKEVELLLFKGKELLLTIFGFPGY